MANWNTNYWQKKIIGNTKQDGVIVSNEMLVKSQTEKRIIKNNELHFIKANNLKTLCQLPKSNEQYRIITEKQFNAYALILYVLENEIIEEMNLAIYRINEPTVLSIINFIESGKIKKANFIISNFFNQTKKPEKWAIRLKEFCDTNNNCTHKYIHNHSKILALKTNFENYYVFEGSGNMSDNARIEQYVFDNNIHIYNFHKNWITNLTKV